MCVVSRRTALCGRSRQRGVRGCASCAPTGNCSQSCFFALVRADKRAALREPCRGRCARPHTQLEKLESKCTCAWPDNVHALVGPTRRSALQPQGKAVVGTSMIATSSRHRRLWPTPIVKSRRVAANPLLPVARSPARTHQRSASVYASTDEAQRGHAG